MAADAGVQPEKQAGNSSLRLRVISAAVLSPIVLGLVWWGGLPFLALLAIVGPIMVSEWASLIAPDGEARAEVWGLSLAILIMLVGLAFEDLGAGTVLALAIVVLTAAIALWRNKSPVRVLWGAAYVGLAVLAFAWLRTDPVYGLIALIWLLGIVWATDICAYFAGRSIGGPKLAPRLSPNKTWAGLIGGVVGAVLVGVLTGFWLETNSVLLGLISGGLAVLSQAGDVTESSLKRRAGVKDSGALIPGHGGILDRVDGLMFAAVGAALIAFVRGGGAEGILLWP
ncbi:MAG: phosphatidate cytidylyltransferase [Parvibaculum sp.]